MEGDNMELIDRSNGKLLNKASKDKENKGGVSAGGATKKMQDAARKANNVGKLRN